MVKDGAEFIYTEPDIVIDFLRKRKIEKIEVNPHNLKIVNSNEQLLLQVFNGTKNEFPLRRSFLYKLLRWYTFPVSKIYRLSPESIASICNDYLLNIKLHSVIVKIEQEDALTIVSPDYNEINDLEIIKSLAGMGARSISRNDFFFSIVTYDNIKTEPVPDDICGLGLMIINSETGFRALTVSHYIYRYICSNGAVVKNEKRDSHYHYGKVNLSSFLNEKINIAAKKRKRIISNLKLLAGKKIKNDKEFYVTKLEKILGRSEVANFFKDFNENLTHYELFNLITDRAKYYDLSKRLYIESLAGDIILNGGEMTS